EFTGAQSCQGLTLAVGAHCYLIYNFIPSTAGAATATSAGTWTGVPFNVTLNGTGVAPSFLVTPSGLDFGEVPVGTVSQPESVTVTNTGTASVVMNGAGGNPGGEFTGAQSCQGLSLAPGAHCYLIYNFLPTTAGPATATSSGTWNGVPFNVSLQGTGGTAAPASGLRITPTGFDFGVVPVGTTSPPLTTVVTNIGSTPVVMSGTGGAASGDFAVTENCHGVTLDPGQSCDMSFTFSPAALGNATATVTGAWNGQAYSIALQGSGGFTVSGFFSPLGPYPEFQQVKAGSAIPLKFSLGGDQGLGILAAGFPVSGPVACGSGSVTTVEATDAAGQSGLQYDPDTETYTYVWKTDRAWGGSCRSLIMKLVDGSVLRANFQFK
ncbi:MAG TPA: PxKF domain-containing protein, partial [Gemmatimonadales bacterium]|nr:PxKF domain-containing protein [Gemmatimonadales bacterium]